MVQHELRRRARERAELLRQIAQLAAQGRRLREHVQAVEMNAAGIRRLQRRQGAHERGFARAVGPEQTEHAGRNVQADVVEGAHSVGVGLGEMLDGQHGRFQQQGFRDRMQDIGQWR